MHACRLTACRNIGGSSDDLTGVVATSSIFPLSPF